MQTIKRQGGWVGLIVVLLALVIVAYLAKDALKSYGLLSGVPAEPARQGERTRLPAAAVDATGMSSDTTPSFQAPMERARGVEATVQQQAEDVRRRMDVQTR